MTLLNAFPHVCDIYRTGRAAVGPNGGGDEVRAILHSGVSCWEQSLTPTESEAVLQKMGIIVNRKIYFLADLGLGEMDDVVITKRNGTTIPVASREFLDIRSVFGPDATAGLAVAFKVLAYHDTGVSR